MTVNRVIPWALPSISGGSQGGYTPHPGPTPTPTNPYDFDNIVWSVNYTGLHFGRDADVSDYPPVNIDVKGIVVSVSGIKINDVSDVGSVILSVESSAEDTTYTWKSSGVSSYITGTKEDLKIDFDIKSIASEIGGSCDNTATDTGLTWNRSGSYILRSARDYTVAFADPKYYIRVYNANGAIMQEVELEAGE